jgi:hypothetical protein
LEIVLRGAVLTRSAAVNLAIPAAMSAANLSPRVFSLMSLSPGTDREQTIASTGKLVESAQDYVKSRLMPLPAATSKEVNPFWSCRARKGVFLGSAAADAA